MTTPYCILPASHHRPHPPQEPLQHPALQRAQSYTIGENLLHLRPVPLVAQDHHFFIEHQLARRARQVIGLLAQHLVRHAVLEHPRLPRRKAHDLIPEGGRIESRSGVRLPAQRDVIVPHHVDKVIGRLQQLRHFGQGGQLRGQELLPAPDGILQLVVGLDHLVRGEHPVLACIHPVLLHQRPGVIHLDPDRITVQALAVCPLAVAGVPAHRVERHELVKLPLAGQQQVRRSLRRRVLEPVDRLLWLRPRGVMDHQVFTEGLRMGRVIGVLDKFVWRAFVVAQTVVNDLHGSSLDLAL
jgi:hypothetical protein